MPGCKPSATGKEPGRNAGESSQPQADDKPLFTRSFVVFNFIVFLSFCNIAIFFQFHEYLKTLPIDPRWFGFLIAVFSLVVIVVRPFISPFLNEFNARRWLFMGTGAAILSLLFYDHARSVEAMTLVRVAHGTGYVVMNTALVALLVGYIPPARSGQAFGFFSVITLLPYAVIPPILAPVVAWGGGFARVLYLSGLLMAFTFPLALLLDPPAGKRPGPEASRPWPRDMAKNFRDGRILLILFISLVVWTTFAPLFFYIDGYGEKLGSSNAGWFFTLSTFSEIGVRLVGGKAFDRYNKRRMVGWGIAWLGLGFLSLGWVSSPTPFFLLGIFLGLGWGVVMPLLTAIVFDISEPRFKALNTNLTMVVFQGGFFLGPLLGGAVLLKWGERILYEASGLVLLATVCLMFVVRER